MLRYTLSPLLSHSLSEVAMKKGITSTKQANTKWKPRDVPIWVRQQNDFALAAIYSAIF